jgi:hypothetical protein
MNSQAISVTGLRLHRPAIAACFVFSGKLVARHLELLQHNPAMSGQVRAFREVPEVAIQSFASERLKSTRSRGSTSERAIRTPDLEQTFACRHDHGNVKKCCNANAERNHDRSSPLARQPQRASIESPAFASLMVIATLRCAVTGATRACA